MRKRIILIIICRKGLGLSALQEKSSSFLNGLFSYMVAPGYLIKWRKNTFIAWFKKSSIVSSDEMKDGTILGIVLGMFLKSRTLWTDSKFQTRLWLV